MLRKSYPYYLANKPVAANTDLEVLDKYSGKRATRVAFANAATVRKAIVAAHKAREAMAAFPPDARRDVLEHCVRRFGERSEELALARVAVGALWPPRPARHLSHRTRRRWLHRQRRPRFPARRRWPSTSRRASRSCRCSSSLASRCG